MNYIGVESFEIAKERVRYRVSKGGHGIPDLDKQPYLAIQIIKNA